MSELTESLNKSKLSNKQGSAVLIKVIVWSLLILISLITIFPYFWMILTSFKTHTEATSIEFQFFPAVFRIESYTDLSKTEPSFLRAMINTLIIEITVIPIGTIVSALAAFAFAKMKLRHKHFWLLFLMSGMMVPYAAVFLPQYRVFQSIGWVGVDGFSQLLPLIVPGFFGNVGMMFFFIQYMKSTPTALIEAAKIDGAGWLKVFFKIVFPVIVPAIAAQVIFWFLGIWNDYFAPSIYLSDKWLTLQALISALNDSVGRRPDIPLVMAGATLGSIPMIVIYIFFQRYFIESLAMTGIKE